MAYESDDSAAYPVLVGSDLRRVRVPVRRSVLGCVGDARVRRVWFEVPRYCDGTDLSACDVQVHYRNAAGDGDWFPVTDAEVADDAITFSWVPSPLAFVAEGNVVASVRLTDGTHEFNSGLATFRVVETLREEANGSPLADHAGDLIVITVEE